MTRFRLSPSAGFARVSQLTSDKFRWALKSGSSGHSWLEDGIAMAVGILLISTALVLYKSAGLLSGGIAGIALLGHYATGTDLGLLFFCLNLPFYWLAAKRMGTAFVVKTFISVVATSWLTELLPGLLSISYVSQPLAGILGGVLLGTGFLILFRHRVSLGGFGILVLYLQERHGWSAGKLQMGLDCIIVAFALWLVPAVSVAWSIAGAVILNLIVAMNHRKDRYIAV